MVEAVLFDWGGTLMRFTWSDDLLAEGHRAGLAALGRDGADELTRRFADELLPRLSEPGAADRVDYREELRGLLGGVPDEELDRFQDAEHEAWAPAHQLAGTTLALLDALRARGLKLGLVANSWPDPPRLLRRDLERLGVAERLDAAVFSAEVGARKPSPEPFRAALAELGVEPERALFVGDRLDQDVAGAAALGLTTVQALWFNADDAEGPEPDFQAFTQMDVLNVVERLNAAA